MADKNEFVVAKECLGGGCMCLCVCVCVAGDREKENHLIVL